MFTANASGEGIATGAIVRVKSDDTQIVEPIAIFDEGIQKFVPIPIDMGGASPTGLFFCYMVPESVIEAAYPRSWLSSAG